jgi:hypothetical protein
LILVSVANSVIESPAERRAFALHAIFSAELRAPNRNLFVVPAKARTQRLQHGESA